MRIYVEDNPAQTLPEDKRIVLKNIEVYKNKKGQWCLAFKSENHKYLHVDFNISTNALGRIGALQTEMLKFSAQGFSIQTGPYNNEDWDWQTIFLVPESEEEYNAISGCAAILPTKWSYECVVVPFEDFYMDEDGDSEPITYKEEKENKHE